jgi:hypothetical protein
MAEMGVRGHAYVRQIAPCPLPEEGPGQLVTGTFRHSRGWVYDLRVSGEEKPIGVTGKHPFWCVDRGNWVSACELRTGERLHSQGGGTPRVESLTLRAEPEPVYNIEVEGDHCYRVGEQGLLVHNASAIDPCDGASPPLTLGEVRYVRNWINVNYNRSGGGPPNWMNTQVIKSMRFLAKDMSMLASFAGGTDPNSSARSWVQNEVGKSCDNAGHAHGDQFGGKGVKSNVFPQHPTANQTDQRTRENRIMAQIQLPGTCRVCIHLILKYDSANAQKTWYTARPTEVELRAWVDGVQFQPSNAIIPNPLC